MQVTGCSGCDLSRRESEHGRTLKRLTGPQDRGRKIRAVYRVGKVLRFNAEAAVALARLAVESVDLALEKIRGVKLHPRLGCQHFHHTSAFRIAHARRKRQ